MKKASASLSASTQLTAHAQAACVRQFEQMMKTRLERVPSSDIAKLQAVCEQAQKMYGAQMHWTGESLAEHTLGVLSLYLPFDPDDNAVIACMVHHALDTQLWTLEDLEREYGSDVRTMVTAVHLLSRVTIRERRMGIDELRLMFLQESADMRIFILILCDYLRKTEMLPHMAPEMRRRLCRDILQLFAPAAARMGVYSLKQRLESRAFPALYPTDAMRIAEQLENLHKEYGDFLSAAADALREQLAGFGIAAHVEGRQKQPYSIFLKMQDKSVTHIQDLFDLYALRVIVNDEAACYQTLGILHRIGQPLGRRFKDYIGFPKPNGYRSLHTTIANLPAVPDGVVVEVQIRTVQMQREAELGLAAHWSYKEGTDHRDAAQRVERHQDLLKRTTKGDNDTSVLSDHIFALTPTGDIVELPEGATPLDFAFAVHTTLGLCFKAAKVNGAIVPVGHPLENGDMVEIIRRTEPKPSYNWLGLLKTASARSRLKRHLALADRDGTIQAGKEMINAELERRGIPALDPDLSLLRSVGGIILPLAEREELLFNVGRKAQTVASLLRHADALSQLSSDDRRIPHLQRTEHLLIAFEDGLAMPHRFARCCSADKGVPVAIVGIAGRDGVVRIHRSKCSMLRHADAGRLIGVRWEEAKTNMRK